MKKFGKLLGIKEIDMRKTLKKLGWQKKIEMEIEDFELFYFVLFDMIFKTTNPDFEEMYIMRQ